MVTTELYISNTKVDTTEDVIFALNYWLADIRNPEDRNTNFSKTVTIPGTAENNKLFTFIYQIGVDSSFNPNLKADVTLFNGGARTFRGYVQLKNIIRKYEGQIEYEINLFGELGNLFQDMGEHYVDELDFSELNHIKDTPTVSASWTNTSGYVYPIINNGQIDVVTQPYLIISTVNMRPAIYAKTIWDKIFDTYGFRYNSTFISGDPFAKLIIPAMGDPKRRTAVISGNVTFSVTAVDTTSVTVNIRKINNGGLLELIYSETKTSSSGFFPTFNISGLFFFDGFDQVYISTSWTSADPGASVDVLSPSVWGVVYNDILSIAYEDGDFQATKSVDQVIPTTVETLVTFPVENYDPDGSYNPGTSIHTVPALAISAQLPLLKQRDFVLGLIRMFNMYLDSDPNDEKLLTVLPRDIYYASGTVIDWSQKVDLSKQWQQQPMPLLNFKTHLWKYKQDEDFYNKLYRDTWGKNYGDKELNVETDFQTETSTIELPFSATPSVQSSVNGFILPTIVKDNPIDFPSGNVFVGNPRILYYGGMKYSSAGGFILTDGVTSTNPSQYPFASHLDDPVNPQVDILFDTPEQVYFYIDPLQYTANNLYNVYYSKFIEEITDKDSKLLTAYLYLTPFDIQKFNFSSKPYLLNHAFRVNKIIDFNPNTPDVTKVELLKMKEGTTFVQGKVRRPIKPSNGATYWYLWISPMDQVYTLINGEHWFYGGSVNDVYDVMGTQNPLSVFSPIDAVF